jgi:hypothetical protein
MVETKKEVDMTSGFMNAVCWNSSAMPGTGPGLIEHYLYGIFGA